MSSNNEVDFNNTDIMSAEIERIKAKLKVVRELIVETKGALNSLWVKESELKGDVASAKKSLNDALEKKAAKVFGMVEHKMENEGWLKEAKRKVSTGENSTIKFGNNIYIVDSNGVAVGIIKNVDGSDIVDLSQGEEG